MYSRKLLKRLQKPKKDPLAFLRAQKIYGRKSHIIATILVLGACLGVTAAAWYDAAKSTDEAFKKVAENRIDESVQVIGNRLTLVGTVLSGGVGLFEASDQVTSKEWEAFIESVYHERLFSVISAFGYVSYVKPGELNTYITTMQQQGEPASMVAPVASNADTHVPVSFIAPSNKKREQLVGYNMYADKVRRKAIDTARDSGTLSLTGKLDLVRDKQGNISQRGLILFAPVYRKNTTVETVEQKRQNIIGLTYAVIPVDDLFAESYGSEENKNIGIEIYENTEKTETNFMYRSNNFETIAADKNSYIKEQKSILTDHPWIITYAVGYDVLSQPERDAPFSSLIRGMVLSLAVAFFVYYLLTHRTRKILEAKHNEVQSAKDDLLSLASHQLRTPATVVKQYVGMLLQGYGGELSDQQKSMLESAYTSNERQLQIINQILYVARLDAGQIKLHKERTNLNKLLKEVVDEHRPSFKESKQKFNLRLPSKIVYIRGDKHYLHMVLDNLLSNAGKYTPSGGRISVSLTASEGRAVISIKDNGVGINKAEQSGIFDKFTRGNSEMTSQVSGSGIGLYLVKKITELHRGSIKARPNRPMGTVFELCLPIRLSQRIRSKRLLND